MSSYLTNSYNILMSIHRDNKFLNLALIDIEEDDRDKALITKIVYGTIEKHFELLHIVNSLSTKQPKLTLRVILMQAAYCILNLSIPAYAIVSESVALAETIEGLEQKGYVNAVLHKIINKNFELPKPKDSNYWSVNYNLPNWVIGLVKSDYPKAYSKILNAQGTELEHIRINSKIPQNEVVPFLQDTIATKTGFFTKNTPAVIEMYREGLLTYQSLTSTYAVVAMGDVKNKRVLDICAAPGGKSVYLAELGALVTATDIHPHRVELISTYARRMNVKVLSLVADATEINLKWINSFDSVLCDVPCSGLGVLSKRRDIIFNRSASDIDKLAELQYQILSNASKYVKTKGALLYSTCTILKRENKDVIDKFLLANTNFALQPIEGLFANDGYIQFLPDDKGVDGFFLCKMVKVC